MSKSAEALVKSISQRMGDLKMTQEALASAAHLTQGRVSQYLKGRAVPSLEIIDRIAAALDTTPADLLGGVSPPKAPPATEALLETIERQQSRIRELEALLADASAKAASISSTLQKPGENLQQAMAILASLPPTDPLFEIIRNAGKRTKENVKKSTS